MPDFFEYKLLSRNRNSENKYNFSNISMMEQLIKKTILIISCISILEYRQIQTQNHLLINNQIIMLIIKSDQHLCQILLMANVKSYRIPCTRESTASTSTEITLTKLFLMTNRKHYEKMESFNSYCINIHFLYQKNLSYLSSKQYSNQWYCRTNKSYKNSRKMKKLEINA